MFITTLKHSLSLFLTYLYNVHLNYLSKTKQFPQKTFSFGTIQFLKIVLQCKVWGPFTKIISLFNKFLMVLGYDQFQGLLKVACLEKIGEFFSELCIKKC